MTRRDAIKNTVGALFGVSVIPAFGRKPRLPFSYDGPVTWINPATHNPDPAVYWKVMLAAAYKPQEVPKCPMRWVLKDGKILAQRVS